MCSSDLLFYKNLAKELGLELNVEFRGALYGKNLMDEYGKTSLFIHPSCFDNFPIVILEAMSCKKPVIATRIGGIPKIIDDGKNGLLVPPKDSEALAKTIIKILENPKLAKKIGKAGYKKIKENITWDVKAEEMSKVIGEILK